MHQEGKREAERQRKLVQQIISIIPPVMTTTIEDLGPLYQNVSVSFFQGARQLNSFSIAV